MVTRFRFAFYLVITFACLAAVACGDDAPAEKAPAVQAAAPAMPKAPDAVPADQTGGFDSAKAYEHVARIVSFGPRYPGSEGHRKAQDYFRSQLKGFGCILEEDEFTASTPKGSVKMKNIIGKAAGTGEGILLLASHYDTVQPSRVADFVGAVDGASGNGVMLELARLLCAKDRKNRLNIWIVFLDGEEAFIEWSDTDSTYGSRQLAAQMSLSGDLKRLKAMVLADLVGEKDAQFKREEFSTGWLADLVWDTAKRLGYSSSFLNEGIGGINDDHGPFLKRSIPAVDIIDLEYPHWHTPQDTLDKISARTLGVTGHVILEAIPALEKRFGGK